MHDVTMIHLKLSLKPNLPVIILFTSCRFSLLLRNSYLLVSLYFFPQGFVLLLIFSLDVLRCCQIPLSCFAAHISTLSLCFCLFKKSFLERVKREIFLLFIKLATSHYLCDILLFLFIWWSMDNFIVHMAK